MMNKEIDNMLDDILFDLLTTDDNLYIYESPSFNVKFGNISGLCKIKIYGNEGVNIPHFHIENVSEDFNVAICLTEAKYFKHGKWKDELNNRQKKQLQNYLSTKKDGMTRWERLVRFWNDAPCGIENPVKIKKIPDYTKMKESV